MQRKPRARSAPRGLPSPPSPEAGGVLSGRGSRPREAGGASRGAGARPRRPVPGGRRWGRPGSVRPGGGREVGAEGAALPSGCSSGRSQTSQGNFGEASWEPAALPASPPGCGRHLAPDGAGCPVPAAAEGPARRLSAPAGPVSSASLRGADAGGSAGRAASLWRLRPERGRRRVPPRGAVWWAREDARAAAVGPRGGARAAPPPPQGCSAGARLLSRPRCGLWPLSAPATALGEPSSLRVEGRLGGRAWAQGRALARVCWAVPREDWPRPLRLPHRWRE